MEAALLGLPTSIHRIRVDEHNTYYIKREDQLNFALGGNKARKVVHFLKEARAQGADVLMTYGSVNSNHCRIVAAVAAREGMRCVLILAGDSTAKGQEANRLLYRLSGAQCVPVSDVTQVAFTIEETMMQLRREGCTPYFIPGGGHARPGTRAYREAFEEILAFEKSAGFQFDRIYLASGTGTTQGGLLAGKIRAGSPVDIVGISIARSRENGRAPIRESVGFDLPEMPSVDVDAHVIFLDNYLAGGYGHYHAAILKEIQCFYRDNAILLDPVYTGKAYHGMRAHLREEKAQGKRILFLHTGGLPVFFSHGSAFETMLESGAEKEVKG